MSSSEARKNMARAGTMQVTSKEGMSYLQQHLPSHYRHLAQLKVHFAEENETKVANKRSASAQKNKSSPAKKPKLAKTRTMAATAKEGAVLLGNEVLGDTREMTKKRKASKTTVGKATGSRKQTKKTKAAAAVAKAKKAKSTKSKAAKKSKKPSLKKASTMVKTAKEGKAFIGKGGTKLSSRRRCQKS